MPAKIIAVNLPYPSPSRISPDAVAAKIIAPAYAAAHSELTAILQYTYHGLWYGDAFDISGQELAQGIAVCEMRHLEILGETLLNLGADPKFVARPFAPPEYYSASAVAYSKTPLKMNLDDIAGEMGAIKGYETMLKQLKNESVAAIIQRILLDEYLHLEKLRAQFAERGD